MSIDTVAHSPDWGSPAADDSPVMLLLHGFGSNERDLPGLAPWLPDGLPWASPRAPLAMPAGGAMWFPLGLPEDPDPDSIAIATTELWNWIDDQVGTKAPVVSLGFSQGGVIALELLRSRPERVAATVLLSGFVAPTVHTADALFTQSRPRVFWGRGDDDTVIPPVAVARTEEYLAEHSESTVRQYAGLGHSVDDRVMTDVRTFLTDALT